MIEARLYEAYSEKKKALQVTIKVAKNYAWEELLRTLDKNSWGALI